MTQTIDLVCPLLPQLPPPIYTGPDSHYDNDQPRDRYVTTTTARLHMCTAGP